MILNSGSKYEHVFKIGRLLCAFDFDFTLEGLEHEMEVRQQILRLQDCRNNGIRFQLAAAFYTKLKSQREQELVERPCETILDYVRSAKTIKLSVYITLQWLLCLLVCSIANKRTDQLFCL